MSAGYESMSQHKIFWITMLLAVSGLAAHGSSSTFTIPAPEPYRQVEFAWRRPAGTNAVAGVLLLVPGFNCSGQAMLGGRWAEFIKMMKISLYKFAAV